MARVVTDSAKKIIIAVAGTDGRKMSKSYNNTINLSEEIAKMLTTLSFEIKTEIRFIPNDEKYAGAVKPDVRAKVRLKKTEDERPTSRRRRRRRRRRDDEGAEAGSQEDSREDRDRVTDADIE